MNKILLTLIITSNILLAGPIHTLMDERIKGQSFLGTNEDYKMLKDGLGIIALQHHSGTSTINNELKIQKKLVEVKNKTTNFSFMSNIKNSLIDGFIGSIEDQEFIKNLLNKNNNYKVEDLLKNNEIVLEENVFDTQIPQSEFLSKGFYFKTELFVNTFKVDLNKKQGLIGNYNNNLGIFLEFDLNNSTLTFGGGNGNSKLKTNNIPFLLNYQHTFELYYYSNGNVLIKLDDKEVFNENIGIIKPNGNLIIGSSDNTKKFIGISKYQSLKFL